MLNDLETCSVLIRQLLWENAYTSQLYAAKNIDALFSVLFNHLSAALHSREKVEVSNPYAQKLRVLRLQMQNTLTEDHSIAKHAAELCISTSHFNICTHSFLGFLFRMT